MVPSGSSLLVLFSHGQLQDCWQECFKMDDSMAGGHGDQCAFGEGT